MTFRDLKRFISDNNNNEEKEVKLQSAERFRIFRHLPFWISDIEEHKKADIANDGNCCFNHVIGLPKKDGIEKPIFDYEMQLVEYLDNNKSIFVKKAGGLGITEILLRYMSRLAVFNSTYHNCRFHIVTGPRIKLAEELTDRIRLLFQNCKTRDIEVKQVSQASKFLFLKLFVLLYLSNDMVWKVWFYYYRFRGIKIYYHRIFYRW